MPIFFRYTTNDLKELYDACKDLSQPRINDFITKHHFYSCSRCGKEEPYDKSPVVHDHLWYQILNNLNIKNNETQKPVKPYTLPNNPEHAAAVKFYKTYKLLNTSTPNEKYTMLCKNCIEKALKRPLYKQDLKDCLMSKKLAPELPNNPNI